MFKILAGRRRVALTLATLALATLLPAQAALAKTFTISGTVVATKGDTCDNMIFTIVTSDIIGKDQPIMVDVSGQSRFCRSTSVGDTVQLEIQERENNTYLALGGRGGGNAIQGSNTSLNEAETKVGSMEAGVGNSPSDDEALNKQHRNSNLKKVKKNDKGGNEEEESEDVSQ